MNRLILAILAALFSMAQVHAADSTCEAQAAEKKLAGAAKASFIKKCEADARGADSGKCAVIADEKKSTARLAPATSRNANPIPRQRRCRHVVRQQPASAGCTARPGTAS